MTNITPRRAILWIFIAVLLVAGLFGVYQRLFIGEAVVNYGSLVPWGLWIAMYTYMAGLSAGLYIFASLGILFNVEAFKPVRRVASVASIVVLMAGLLHVWFDLGHMERFLEVFFRPSPTSIMGLVPWAYTAFIIVVAIQLYLDFTSGNEGTIRLLGIVGLVLAVIFSGGEGALLGVLGSRPGWHSGLFPIRFMVTGVATAGAALIFLVVFFWKNEEEREAVLPWLTGITLGVLALNTLMDFADISTALYGGSPAEKEALQVILSGNLSGAFWIAQVVMGIVIPAIALIFFRKNRMILGIASLILMVGFVSARMNLLVPVLSVPELEGITSAYTSARISTAYFPSLTEWLVTGGILGLALAAYSILWDRLALDRPKGA